MIENLQNEIWYDIPGYEGLYQLSNLDRIKSLERFRLGQNQRPTRVKERIKKLVLSKGYLGTALCKNGIQWNSN